MEQLLVEATLPIINTNYTTWRKQLEFELAQYDVVLVLDDVPAAKKLATELNKMTKAIADRRKEVVAAVGGPLKEFESEVKILEAMCQEGRKKILYQIEAFEAVTLKRIEEMLRVELQNTYNKYRVDLEYQTAEIDDLVKLGAITTTGKSLTSGAKASVAARVGECMNAQQRTALRLSELENRSHRAGLHSPLTREHVAGILFLDDEAIYQSNLMKLIDRELERQGEIIAAAKKIQEMKEYRDTAPLVQGEMSPQVPAPIPDKIIDMKLDQAEGRVPPELVETLGTTNMEDLLPPAGPVLAGWKRVTIILDVQPPVGTPNEKILAALSEKLAKVGIKDSVRSINVTDLP